MLIIDAVCRNIHNHTYRKVASEMGIVSSIKDQAKKSGGNKAKFIYFREGEKTRVRFLQELDDGLEINWHDGYNTGVNVPCQEIYGRHCEFCARDGLRTRPLFVWNVWDYEAKEVRLLREAVNSCTPVNALVACSENYGTIRDRDYVITQSGKSKDKTFTVIPMDKQEFRNSKAMPYSKSAVLAMLDKAWPVDGENDGGQSESSSEYDYATMSARQLYDLCQKRGIDVQPRMDEQYYIIKLTDSDTPADNGWGPEPEQQQSKYTGMAARQLYDMCMQRGIRVEPRMNERYYTLQLEESDKQQADWGAPPAQDDWGALPQQPVQQQPAPQAQPMPPAQPPAVDEWGMPVQQQGGVPQPAVDDWGAPAQNDGWG